jgi:hypothetical protein
VEGFVKPFRLHFEVLVDYDEATVTRNSAVSSNFPRIERRHRDHPVAVVGGGPLLDIEAVRHWPGDVWAINFTADFLLDRGIDCTFFTIDPAPILKTTAAKRLLASHCDPSLFAGEVQCFDLSEHARGGVAGGTTTATRAPLLAVEMGYPGAVFFGCESSFAARDHVDRDEGFNQTANLVIIRADGADWKTSTQMLLQAQELSWFIRNCPCFREESGGLLRAMVRDDNWEVVGVNQAMKAHLIDCNGDIGLYDEPYQPLVA